MSNNNKANEKSDQYQNLMKDFFKRPTDEQRNKILNFVIERFIDLRTLDVITLKGNFNLKLDENTDFFEELKKKNPSEVTVFAETHIQIDGDTVNVIPYETPNDSAYKEIMEFHNMTVNSAREQWTNRIEMISKFINSLLTLLTQYSRNFPTKVG